MRIGIDARLWNETGVGRYIRNLIDELQVIDKKNDYVLFVSKGIKNQELRIKENWQVVETDIHWHTFEEQFRFPQILEKENLDLVHFPYFSVPIFYNRPFIITIHDLIINHYPTGKASTLPFSLYYFKLLGYKYVIKQAAQKAKKVLTVSHATKQEIVQHLGVSSNKVLVTYEGVEDKIKKKAEFEVRKLPFEKEKYFLYVGNAYPHKNLEKLIDGYALVSKDYPNVKLVFVGKKNYFYERLAQKVTDMELEKNIIFMGSVTDEELTSLYHHAEALILPSLMEGFGLPGLEAMQSGCLVLASAIPSLKEIYGDAAVYFDPLAIDTVHVTIREVLENKKKFQIYVEKGKRHVLIFSWRKMAEETLKIYESCFSIRSDK